MDLLGGMASLFRMSDSTWERHANPWSVWTLFVVLPALAAAIWSREWIRWYSLIPVGATIIWTFMNPRAFPKPKSTNSWGSKAVLGERVWLRRKKLPIPQHHIRPILVLNVITASGAPFLLWGLWSLQIWPTVLGSVLIYLGKMWFLDRMVWLFEDMKDADPEYRSWLY